MPESATALEVSDLRDPFTKAIQIIRDGGPCPEAIVNDLSEVVIELARGQFGTTSEVMVEAALEGAVALIGEGLILSAGRDTSDERLAELLSTNGIRGACAVFSQYLKECVQGSQYHTVSTVLFDFFNANARGGWRVAHARLRSIHKETDYEVTLGSIKEWLFENTTHGRIAKRNKYAALHNERDGEVVRRIFLQYCDIKDNIETEFEDFDPLVPPDPNKDIFHNIGPIALLPRTYNQAKRRYRILLAKMPTKFRFALEDHSGFAWFDEHVRIKKPGEDAPKKVGKTVPKKVKAKVLRVASKKAPKIIASYDLPSPNKKASRNPVRKAVKK